MKFSTFAKLSLATWRLSSLLANEDGPSEMFKKIRVKSGVVCPDNDECFGKNQFAKGLLCEWCNSVWIGTAISLGHWLFGKRLTNLLTPLSLSAVVIIIKYTIETLQSLSKLEAKK